MTKTGEEMLKDPKGTAQGIVKDRLEKRSKEELINIVLDQGQRLMEMKQPIEANEVRVCDTSTFVVEVSDGRKLYFSRRPGGRASISAVGMRRGMPPPFFRPRMFDKKLFEKLWKEITE
jgi:hypothetical protein